jgi:hypothetical protein
VQRKYNAMEFELILAVLLGTPQGIQKWLMRLSLQQVTLYSSYVFLSLLSLYNWGTSAKIHSRKVSIHYFLKVKVFPSESVSSALFGKAFISGRLNHSLIASSYIFQLLFVVSGPSSFFP